MRHRRSDGGLHPLTKFVIALLATGVSFVWLSKEWDRRVASGFPLGQKPVPVVAADAPAPVPAPPATLPAPVEDQAQTAAAATVAAPPIEVYFSPKGGATEAVVRELGRAKQHLRVQAYSLTSAPIAKALVDAKKRGLDVTVVLDSSQRAERYTSATFLFNEGVPVYIDDDHAIAHNKVILIDDNTVITGSFNFTRAAEERNAENLLVIRGRPEVAEKYHGNFEKHLAHSKPYARSGE
jgi:phosphatidylserine/phosphatidylglycerophosphate/cardiolipin synthase-like enzyme